MRRFLTASLRCACVWAVAALVAVLPLAPAQAGEAPVRVAFFNPHGADDPFWRPVGQFMRAAAKDLGMEITIYVAGHNRMRMIEQVREAVTAQPKPDFLVFKNFKANAPEILAIAEEHGVKSFMFNAGLTSAERARFGGPRERFTQWIGETLPGDELAGYILAKALLARAEEMGLRTLDGRIEMVGLTGPLSESAAIERNKGLAREVEEGGRWVRFRQLVPARWSYDQARDKGEGLLKRYPDVTVVWAANDSMALGAIAAAKNLGKIPGRTILAGGMDWNPPALDAIRAGEMHMSIGGHFMEGGWVMVLLYDYAHGLDFINDGGIGRFGEMTGLTQDNLGEYIVKLQNEDWDRVDFTQFSKVRNPALKSYDFSLERVLEQL